jgi:hypothetical protein
MEEHEVGVAAAFAVLYKDPPDDPVSLAGELLFGTGRRR